MKTFSKISLQSIAQSVFFSPETNAKRLSLFPLRLAAFLYEELGDLRRKAYEGGMLHARKLSIPVVSVGNLTVGGTGKTPTTLYLARLLQGWGKRVAVLSRGYKGKAPLKINVVSDGKTVCLGPEGAGDEPFLLAEKLPGVPVLTGKDRGALGEYAWRNFASELVILDDGFQHVRLKRDLDILVLDGGNPFGNGYVLPRGNLRESPKHLERADLILINNADSPDMDVNLVRRIRSYNSRAPVFSFFYVPTTLRRLQAREECSLDCLRGCEVVALAGLASPGSFCAVLRGLGAKIVDTMFYPDHHRYHVGDICTGESKALVVTTEKDAVKLRQFSLMKGEVLVLGIDVQIDKEIEFFDYLKNRLPSLF